MRAKVLKKRKIKTWRIKKYQHGHNKIATVVNFSAREVIRTSNREKQMENQEKNAENRQSTNDRMTS
jgi:hypothetical protein